jgi:hypothetical protein
MEAATPLRKAHVGTVGDRLTVDGLIVDDECSVRLVREREQAGEDPALAVTDAIEIGARVLDREHAAANTEFVKTELERVSRQVEAEFGEKARTVVEFFDKRVESVFGPENGHLAKELEKLFSDGSSASVQNRTRELLAETLAKAREDLQKQFTSADGTNPLADFKQGMVRAVEQAQERQHRDQQVLLARVSELDKQMQALRLEKEKLEEVAEERERGTAKGRTFEEQVAEAVEEIACGQGDDADAVGDLPGATGKTGDVVVCIEAASGPARGRIVFEAKDRRLSKPKAIAELDKAMSDRDADFAVLVVPSEEEVPAKMQALREYNGDKLIVTLDPEDSAPLALEVGYRLARARVLMSRATGDGVDAAAVRDTVQRALGAMDDVRRVKSQLTGAKTKIDDAAGIVDAMALRVRAHLAEIDELVLSADASVEEPEPLDDEQPELTLD